MGTKGEVKKYSELSKRQKADVKKRMKPPYVSYLYKIYGGKVSYRFLDKRAQIPERKRSSSEDIHQRGKFGRGGHIEAYTFGEGERKPRWPFKK